MKKNKILIAKGITLALIVLLLDQFTKWMVLNKILPDGGSEQLFPFFNFTLVWNKGVSFGFMAGNHSAMPYVLTAFALILVAFVAYWLIKSTTRWQAIACGLIIGGAIGNVIDRLRFGAVTDFIDLHLGGWHYPAFNVADSAIVIGAILLLWDSVFRSKSGADEKPQIS